MTLLNVTRLFGLTTLLLSFSIQSFSNSSPIEQQALLFLQEHYRQLYPQFRTTVSIHPLNKNIALPNCSTTPAMDNPRGAGKRIIVRASCNSPYWQIFISAEANHFSNILIAKEGIHRGTQLSADNVELREASISIGESFISNIDDIQHFSAKRFIQPGQRLKPSLLTENMQVKKGDAVIIEARRGSLTVKASGTALSSGAINQQILVRNDRSGNEIKAVIIAPGLVRTP